jgi:hypothetical protein
MEIGDGRRFLVVMLGGGCDGFVGGGWVELAAEFLEFVDGGGGHGDASPAAAGPVEHGPDQVQAGAFAGEPADDLDPPAGLTEGALD